MMSYILIETLEAGYGQDGTLGLGLGAKTRLDWLWLNLRRGLWLIFGYPLERLGKEEDLIRKLNFLEVG